MLILSERNVFQQYYSDYKVIFLIDRQSGIKVREGAVIDDLTDRTMEERIMVSRPYSDDIEKKFGLVPELFLGDEPLTDDREFPAYKGQLIDIIAKRKGFNNVSCQIKADEDKKCCSFVSTKNAHGPSAFLRISFWWTMPKTTLMAMQRLSL